MKSVTYDKKHLSTLKEYCVIKLMFTFLISLVLLLQSAIWLIVWHRNKSFSISDMVVVAITLGCCISMIISQMTYYRYNRNIVKQINEEGKFEIRRDINFRFNAKSGLSWGILLLFRIFTITIAILTGILVVEFVQDYLNWGEVILKMPILLLLLIAFMNTSASLRLRCAIDKINIEN